jgi:predicted phosphodiesterase
MLDIRTEAGRRAEYLRKYGSGLEKAVADLDPSDLAYLDALPRTRMLEFSGRTLLLAHGAPWDTDEYLYPDTPQATLERVAESGADIVVLGHTHYQVDWQLAGCRIINPGSVGQPRDRSPGAAWSILDTDSGTVIHCREAYNTERVVAAVRQRDPSLAYNWTVLLRT